MIITPILDETEESQYEDHVRTTPSSPPPANDVQLQSNDTAQPNAADGDDAEDEATKTRTGRKRFMYVPCPHTAEVLSEALMECLLDWNIDGKISTITVDNCTTNDLMIKNTLEKLSSNSLLLGGDLFHMRCCAHILALIVKQGLEGIKGAIELIRNSVSYWKATPKRVEKFEEAARQLNIACTNKLVLDCETRWNSTYMMLNIAIKYQRVFTRLKQREPQYKYFPGEEDWSLAREMCDKLKIFYNFTEKFSGVKYPTTNLFFPSICEIRLSLNEWSKSKFDVIREMASDFEMTRVSNLCFDLAKEYELKVFADKSIGQSDFSSTSRSEMYGLDDDVDPLDKFDMFVSNSTQTSTVKSELTCYLEESLLPRANDFDILAWWKKNGIKYPVLQCMARDILVIPVSIVASESAFSTGGRFVSIQRNRLHPKTLEALMCTQDWLWDKMEGELKSERGTFWEDNEEDHVEIINMEEDG
ncbi:zinc finger BED domain-containing protein RICESLEEPER 2-like [Papaver somniferum]|uniref:zinc finger BED domain-containing protein RICESLEEPER 2-like n=1 Tax=Papaver somniferum TaxID=3469 RepID=UPI000E6FB3EA|nr:zinc finger BED domain-containing protein RICESLEEPER 2-like [Papaver somniferum]